MARVVLSLIMTKAGLLIRQAETRPQMTRAPFLKTDIKKTENYINTFIMADSILSHNDFMQQLDLEDMQIDGEEEYSLPSGHVLNIAFFMEPDSEDGQGYNWAESPKPEVCIVPEHDPSVRTAALIKEAEDKVEAAALALLAYSQQIVNKTCHKHKDVQRQKLDSLEAKLGEAKRALRLLCGGFQ